METDNAQPFYELLLGKLSSTLFSTFISCILERLRFNRYYIVILEDLRRNLIKQELLWMYKKNQRVHAPLRSHVLLFNPFCSGWNISQNRTQLMFDLRMSLLPDLSDRGWHDMPWMTYRCIGSHAGQRGQVRRSFLLPYSRGPAR